MMKNNAGHKRSRRRVAGAIALLLVCLNFPQIASSAALDANEAEVGNFNDLKTVLTDSAYNNISTIYMGGDIVCETDTFSINKDHVDVTIVGHPKGESSTRYTIQDNPRSYIHIGKNGRTVTLKEMDIRGYNYYGTINCNWYTDTTLKFDKVNYLGSQAVYNRMGDTIFQDTNVTIGMVPAEPARFPVPPNQDPPQEVAESPRLTFGGNCVFTKDDNTSSLFFMPDDVEKYVRVLPDANVSIINNSTSDTYGDAFYIDHSETTAPPLTIGDRAKLFIDVQSGVQRAYDMRFDSVTVGPDASLRVIQRGDPDKDNSTISINKSLTVEAGATLEMTRVASTKRYAPLILLFDPNGTISFNDPKRILLYNPSKRMFTTRSGPFTITGSVGAINVWTSGTLSDSIDNMPKNMWNKQNGANLSFNAKSETGRISVGTNYASISNFNTKEDFYNAYFDKNSFVMNNMLMLTMGRYTLNIDPLYIPNTTVTGNVGGGSNTNRAIRLRYAGNNGKAQEVNASVDSYGDWTAKLVNATVDANLQVLSHGHSDYLTFGKRTKPTKNPGELSFLNVPGNLAFAKTKPPLLKATVPRVDTSWTISISDTRTRAKRAPWKLTASIGAPLTGSMGGATYTLNDALVFVDSQGQATPLTNSQLLIYSSPASANKRTDINWPADKGILLRVLPGQAMVGVRYETTIRWTLSNAP
ncbi:MAG: hypothetical protein LBC58_03325 [Clostridiales Family XIII bacterium]|jgi:hypothetical protein|nr:hypothetical protein [Clostridiales Family XIII bacterium]